MLNITLKELDIFSRVAGCSSITELSKTMGISQPHISITIKSLEKKLNEKLFDRIGKKIFLNERGRLFHSKVTFILYELKELKDSFTSNQLEGDINIGSSNTLAIYFLPYLLYEYRQIHENINVTLFSQNNTQLIKMIYEGKIDIALIESEINDFNLEKVFLKSDEVVVVTSDKSLTKRPYYIDELIQRDWILREQNSGIRETFEDKLGEINVSLNVKLEIPHTLAIKNLLKRYPQTLSCLSLYSVSEELKNETLYKVEIKNLDFFRNFYLIYHKNKFKNAIFKSFKQFVQTNSKTI